MQWHEISIEIPYEYVEPISYLFDRYGHGMSMEIQGSDQVLLRTYLPAASSQRFAHIEVGVRLINLLQPLGELKIEPLPLDEDWQNAWKSHFDLLKLGQHLVIKPSWIDYDPAPEDIVIELDPGMAFGTGYHPTTYTCLEALEHLIEPGMAVLDLGVGSGILTIAAAKLGAGRILALDIDSIAIKAARQNFRRLGIMGKISLAQGTVPHAIAKPGEYDIVVANISANVLIALAPHAFAALAPGGVFVGSGLLTERREAVEAAFTEAGADITDLTISGDWAAFSAVLRPV